MNIFKKYMLLIADVFMKLRTPKKVVKQISKKSTFRGPFHKQHAKGYQTLFKSEPHHLYHIYCSLWRQFCGRQSLLVICKVLRLLLNTLTADDKYSLVKRDNLRKPIQMQLSQEQESFSQFLFEFLKGSLNFEHFQSEDEPHSWSISEITDSEIPGEINVQKFPFQRTHQQATSKGFQTLLKSEPHHFYHIYWSLSKQLSWKNCLLVTCKVLRLFVKTLNAGH